MEASQVSAPLPWEAAQKEASQYVSNFADMEQRSTNTDVDENTPWGRAIIESQQKPTYDFTAPKTSEFDMPTYLRKMFKKESSNVADAKNTKSTATGVGQFLEGTWNEWVDKLGLDYTLEDRKDPKKVEVVAKAFTEANRKKAEGVLGREPNMVETYMYHFLGDAGKFLAATDDTPATQLATKQQVRSNREVFYKDKARTVPRTKGEIMKMFERKFN